jgi:hypothetical protein
MAGAGRDPGLPWRIGLFALVLALALLPIYLAGPVPAMVDYPNHLSRMAVLTRDGTAGANPFYQTAWALYPNLAMDLIIPPVARVIGVEAATRAFLVVCQLLVVFGAVAIELVVKRRFGFAGLVACLLLYSDPFAWGFINFEFGLGAALLAFAAWMGMVERPLALRIGFHAMACLVLFVSHMFALGIYGWAVGLFELWRWRRSGRGVGALVGMATALALPLLGLAGLVAVVGGGPGGQVTRWDLPAKALWLLCLNGYNGPLSIALSLLLLLLIYVLARRGRLKLVGAGPWLAIGFLVLFLIMPHKLLDTEFVDVRVVVATFLILPGFTVIAPLSARLRWSALAVVCAVGVVDLAEVAAMQVAYRAEYRTLVASFAQLPPHARVLVGHSGKGDDPPRDLSQYPMYHAPVMAVEVSNAFVTSLFTYAGKQPILARPWIRRLSLDQGGPIPEVLLAAIAHGWRPPPEASFVAYWTRDFDVLYLVGPPIPNPLPDVLAPIASGRRFVMYRIKTRDRSRASGG